MESRSALISAWIAGALVGGLVVYALGNMRLVRADPRGVGGAPYQWVVDSRSGSVVR